MSETVTPDAPLVVEEGEDAARLHRPERPAQGGQAARPGRGRLLRRRQAARHGLRPLRPLAVRARDDHVDRRLEGARARRRLRDADRRRGRDPHRPVLPDLDAARARTSRTTRSRSARCATSASRSPRSSRATRELARDAAELVEVEYEPLPVLVDAEEALEDDAPVLHEDAGSNVVWAGRLRLGRLRRRARRGRPRRQDRAAALRPLLLDAARVRRRARRVQPRHRAVDDPRQPPVARASARSGWRRRCASGSTSSASSRQDIGGGFGNKICLHPQFVALLPARAQAQPAGAVDGVAHRPAHRERARERAHRSSTSRCR